jgi:flagellar basal-body rod protein FlgG
MTQKMNTISNNIANINTEGFRQEKITFKPFLQEINGTKLAEKQVDFSTGSQKETGRELDFAISGDAFFTIVTEEGDQYIRNGSFTCDSSGYLRDKNGNQLKGVSGYVKMADGKPDQAFALVDIPNKASLIRQADGFKATDQTIVTPVDYEVAQGRLETSNVDLINHVTEMISTSRNYAMNTRMLMTMDEMMKKAANEIGLIK